MTKRTLLFEEHQKLGARIVDFAGWEMPVQYSGVTDEHLAVRNAAGLFDVSHMGIFEISGDNSPDFLNYLTPSNIDKLENMQAVYSLLLTEKGTIIDDIIIYRLTEKGFLMVANASNVEKDLNWIKRHLTENVTLENVSSAYALMAIQGPKAASILSKISSAPLDRVNKFRMTLAELTGVGEVLLARTGYTGEDGFEIFAPNSEATDLWRTLIEIGKSEGLKPVGLGARDTLRLEMKYTLYGHEITEETNALEAGLGWVVKLKKSCDFIGKAALLKVQQDGLSRKLVGFKLIDKGVPRDGYPISLEGKNVGVVTSGTFSPSLKSPIGIAYIKTDLAKTGTKFSVDIRGKERQAEVVETPFYTRTS